MPVLQRDRLSVLGSSCRNQKGLFRSDFHRSRVLALKPLLALDQPTPIERRRLEVDAQFSQKSFSLQDQAVRPSRGHRLFQTISTASSFYAPYPSSLSEFLSHEEQMRAEHNRSTQIKVRPYEPTEPKWKKGIEGNCDEYKDGGPCLPRRSGPAKT